MGKKTQILLVLGLVVTLFSGCVVVINNGKPTGDEQALLNIQSAASQEVAQISRQIQSGNYSVAQVQELIASAKKIIDENIKKIDALKIPERTKDLAQKTKDYLEKATQTYGTLLQISGQTGAKLQELASKLQTLTQPLADLAGQLEAAKNTFLKELRQATTQK